MKKVEGLISESIHAALHARISADKETADHILSVALAQYLDRPLHTLFSVSTSAALVEGLYQDPGPIAGRKLEESMSVTAFRHAVKR